MLAALSPAVRRPPAHLLGALGRVASRRALSQRSAAARGSRLLVVPTPVSSRGVSAVRSFASSSSRPARRTVDYLLADVGEGITECEIIKWFVSTGTEVSEFDALVEVQSDKASVEITSRYAGRVVETCYSVGEVARVGSPLCRIEVDDGEAGDAAPEPAAPEPAKPAAAAPEAAAPEPEAAPAAASAPEEPFARGKHASLATPAVRRITREEGIDIASVPGTGKDGRVTKEDVLGFVARRKEGGSSSGAPAPAPAAPQAGEQVVEMSSIRRAMFKGMTATWAVPHFGYSEEVDVTELDALRKSLAVATGSKLTLLPFLLKALSLVLPEHPLFRSTLDAASTPAKLRQRDSHDVSLALSSPFGLLTPSLPDLRTLSILEIAAHIASLQSKASAGPLSRADMGRPATLTLSNIGAVGGTAAAPLLPPTGQLTIGAVGRTKLLPRYDAAGNIVPRLLLPTSWSADHRVVEGAELARLVAQWKEMCEQPQSWLARLR